MNTAALGYTAGARRGRLLLIHPVTGWRISLPAADTGDGCDGGELAQLIVHRAAQARPTRVGVGIFRVPVRRREVAELMRRIPRSR